MKVELTSDKKYSETKEFLERQQNIDLLIALARIGEVIPPKNDLEVIITSKIRQTLDKL